MSSELLQSNVEAFQREHPTVGKQLFSILSSSHCELSYFKFDLRKRYEASARINPGSSIKTQFGISLEIPVVISLHRNLQPRVLSQFDLFRDNPAVDPDIGILVASDKKAVNYARDRRRTSFSVVTLLEENLEKIRTSSNLRTELANNLRSTNQFDLSIEIYDSGNFFGRNEDIVALTDIVAANQCVGLFGLRKSGKTSLLHQVRNTLSAKSIPSTYIQLNHISDEIEFRRTILKEIYKTTRDNREQRPPKLKTLDKNGRPLTTISDLELKRTWISDLEKLCDHLPTPQALVVDEIDLANEDYRGPISTTREGRFALFQVMRELRGLVQLRRARNRSSFTIAVAGVASSISTAIERFEEENQLFQFFSIRPLRPFNRTDLRDMVRTLGKRSGLHFKQESLFDLLLKEYGGHPHLTRQACSLVAESERRRSSSIVPFSVSEEDLRAVFSNPSASGPLHASRQTLLGFGKWYPDEYAHIEEALSLGRRANPAIIPYAIDFGVFNADGTLRINALSRYQKNR